MMDTSVRVAMRRLPVAPGVGAMILGLVLLTGGCAHSSSSNASSGMTSQELYNEYDADQNGQLTQGEWDQAYHNMDTNGDGVVSHDEFNAATGGHHY
jgi:hypothetical protein